MKVRNILFTILTAILFFSAYSTRTYASVSLYPYKQETTVTTRESTKGSFTFKNDNNYSVTVQPQVVNYDAENQQILKDGKVFVKISQATVSVNPGESKVFNYEMAPEKDTLNGTYFNLIIVQQTLSSNSNVAMSANVSQLVVLNIVDSKENLENTSGELLEVDLRITQNGIPFLLPTKIKYTITNKSNFVLNPLGEIVIFSDKNNREKPIYIKVNPEEKKLYPNKTIEEEISIEKWSISNLIYERNILGKFYNGLYQKEQTATITQQPQFLLPFAAVVILLEIIVLTVLYFARQKKKKSK